MAVVRTVRELELQAELIVATLKVWEKLARSGHTPIEVEDREHA